MHIAEVLLFASVSALAVAACGSDDVSDAGSTDSGLTEDAGSADGAADTGVPDTGADSGPADSSPADSSPADSSPADSSPADSGPADSGPADSGTADGGSLTCTMGTETAVGQLCVVDASTAGGTVTFQVRPAGCLSSSCTIRHTTTCTAVRSGSTFDLSALFCLEPTGDAICTSDCGGGGTASCSASGVEAGSFTATLGSLSVSFTVPSTLPSGGVCDGSPF